MDNNGDVHVPGFDPISGKLGERKAGHLTKKQPTKNKFGDDLFEPADKRMKRNLTLVAESTHSPNHLRNSKTFTQYSNSPLKRSKTKVKKSTRVLTNSVGVW